MDKDRALIICSLSAILYSTIVGSAPAPADVDCSRRQDFNAVRGCCTIPTFHFKAFQKQCGRYMPESGPRVSPALKNCCKMPLLELSKYTSQCGQYLVNGAHITPCSFECLFEAAKALNGTSLVMENIRKMMETLLESHQEFVDIYTEGFHHCSGEEQAMIKSLKRRRMPVTGKCSSMSVMYGLCAHRYVYRNCPESASSKSTMCIEAREYSIHCE
uniref:Putative dimer odorant-binding protein OBP30074 n=1 Tax=Drosophila pseudoobscura pseudoobscura TaxID=46245 RepID=Q706D5_DROPS|nr:putative dimer odorant-binding protein OBP30074 [Drosophila pseudoobscura]